MNLKVVNKKRTQYSNLNSKDYEQCECRLHDAILHEMSKEKEKKRLLFKSGSIDQLRSLNYRGMPLYFNVSNKTMAFNSQIRDEDSSRNRYTMHIPYIKNKEMHIMVDNNDTKEENGRYTDRPMDYKPRFKANHIGGNNQWSHNDNNNNQAQGDKRTNAKLKVNCFSRNASSPQMILNNEAIVSSMHNSQNKDNTHFNIDQHNHPQDKTGLRNKTNNNNYSKDKNNNNNIYSNIEADSQPFYRELGKQKSDSILQFLTPLKNNYINLPHSERKRVIGTQLQKTNFLNRLYKDKIPLQYPFSLSNPTEHHDQGKRNRYINIMNELYRVKYTVAIEKENEKEILKEFLIKNGIYNKLDINDNHFDNLSKFLQGELRLNNKTMSKPFKHIIIDILKNQIHNDNKEDIRDMQVINNTPTSTQTRFDKEKVQSKELIRINEIYSIVPLSNQNKPMRNKIKEKQLVEIVKDLESELDEITKAKREKILFQQREVRKKLYEKAIKPFASSREFMNDKVNKKSINTGLASNMINDEDYDLILSNIKNVSPQGNGGVLLEDKMCSTLRCTNTCNYKNIVSKKEPFRPQFDIKEIKAKKKLTEYLFMRKAKQEIEMNALIKNFDIDHLINSKECC